MCQMLYYLLCLLSPSAKPFLTRMLHIGARGFLYEIRITLEGATSAHAKNTPSQSSSKAQSGATSAHAKNTAIPVEFQGPIWNYLRVRGEYVPDWAVATPLVELPPRTRRIPAWLLFGAPRCGTTSAHAENTRSFETLQLLPWNYLRARGEYTRLSTGITGVRELPPRTRRIRTHRMNDPISCGTTSAHAENTNSGNPLFVFWRNYLRARGEYSDRVGRRAQGGELPPRTRRIPLASTLVILLPGTTSAHAENTTRRLSTSCGSWNYLRARGEYLRVSHT